MTSEDVLIVKQINNTSLVSVQGIQNLVGGTDIKVNLHLCYTWAFQYDLSVAFYLAL